MSWHFEFNAATSADALRVWDEKVAGINDYTKAEASPEFAAMRACVARLMEMPNGFWSIKSYGQHCRDNSKAAHPTHLYSIFFEIKRRELE